MKVIFIRIPKTASQAISRSLRKIDKLVRGGTTVTGHPTIYRYYGDKHLFVKEYDDIDIQSDEVRFKSDRLPVMAVVRNPYDRLYSAYSYFNDRLIALNRATYKAVKEYLLKDCDAKYMALGGKTVEINETTINQLKNEYDYPSIPFETFVLTYGKYHNTERWFHTCYDYVIMDDEIVATDILYFENLESEYNNFCKKYGIENNLIVSNVNKEKKYPDKKNLYTKEMRAIVEKYYKNDFTHFNYNYEHWVDSGWSYRPNA